MPPLTTPKATLRFKEEMSNEKDIPRKLCFCDAVLSSEVELLCKSSQAVIQGRSLLLSGKSDRSRHASQTHAVKDATT